jgi:hypothetical protein
MPPIGEVGVHLAPDFVVRLLAGPYPVRAVGLVIDNNHEALAC